MNMRFHHAKQIVIFCYVACLTLTLIASACRSPAMPTPSPWYQDAAPEDGGYHPEAPDSGTRADASISGLVYRGTNLSGAEFGESWLGDPGSDYQYPDPSDVEYFRGVGMNHFRIPFRPERMQPVLLGPLDEAEFQRMATLAKYATDRNIAVTLAPFGNFRHKGTVVTEAQTEDFWFRIASRFANNSRVSYNATNEPYGMTTETVVALDKASLRGVRRAAPTALVLVPGNAYTGGGHWNDTYYGTANAAIMDSVAGTDANVVFEVHQYLDANADGKGADCVSIAIGGERLQGFVMWALKYHRRGWLGEFAGKNTTTCKAAVTNLLGYVESHPEVFLGWDWWGAGVWSFHTTYPFSIGPDSPPKPQLAWLIPFVPGGVLPP